MSRYRFIHAGRANDPIATLCRVLRAARSAYYAWARRGVSARAQADAALAAQIAATHARSRRTYGAPRVHANLRAVGVCCARKRVARLMRTAGFVGCRRRRRARTTITDPAHIPASNLVAHDFAAPAPDALWLGDSTYLPTGEGWRYLAVLLDAHARWVVGWTMADHRRTALAASFFATLKAELGDTHPWPTRAAARTAVFAWVEVFYNRQRAHSVLAYRPPAVFEELLLLSLSAA